MSFLDHKFAGVWEDRNTNDLLLETSRHSLTMSSLVVNDRCLRQSSLLSGKSTRAASMLHSEVINQRTAGCYAS